MQSHSTAQALIQVRGPEVTYGVIKLRPEVDAHAHSIDISSFTLKHRHDVYPMNDIPLSRMLPRSAQDDILYHTFEADEGERTEAHIVDFEIPDYDHRIAVKFRAVEHKDTEMLFFEVEDECGDWQPIENMLFLDIIDPSFISILESSVIENLSSHSMDYLPMTAEC